MFELYTTEEQLLIEDIINLTAIINSGEFDFSNIEDYNNIPKEQARKRRADVRVQLSKF